MYIRDYEIIGSLRTDNSGTAKWGFARRQGRGEEVFIKEFLTPAYPYEEADFSPRQIEAGKRICSEFELKKSRLYTNLSQCKGGGVVSVKDFFRFKSKYYVITEKVDMSSIEPESIMRLSLETRLMICKVIAYNMVSIHEKGIIHADIKPNNILIKQTISGYYTAKIIDFDSSFFEDDIPSPDDLQCDTVYLAPEAFLYICEEIESLSTKIDIFALGVLFCQYLTGSMPFFNKDEYTYLYASILDGAGFSVRDNVPDEIKELLYSMLAKEPEDRPDIQKVLEILGGQTVQKDEPKPPEPPKPPVMPVIADTSAVPRKKKGFGKAKTTL